MSSKVKTGVSGQTFVRDLKIQIFPRISSTNLKIFDIIL